MKYLKTYNESKKKYNKEDILDDLVSNYLKDTSREKANSSDIPGSIWNLFNSKKYNLSGELANEVISDLLSKYYEK